MTYAHVRALFDRVAGLPTEERHRIFESERIDSSLRDEVEALLAADGATVPDLIGRVVEDAARAALPHEVGPWRVLGLLGEGGMGVVLRGERADGQYQREVAIKLIRGSPQRDVVERFRRERQLLASLDHPDIASLLDGGMTESGEPYLVMPLIEGLSLMQWVRDTSPPLRARLTLFVRLCRAVQYAHQHLIVHRDLKPSNVIVRADGGPVLLDFGIAKLLDGEADGATTVTVARVMTPAYASPEQIDGGPVTTATDVYGLGLILHELLTGMVPARSGASQDSHTFPPPSRTAASAPIEALRADASRLRGDLDRIVRRALRADPELRYPGVAALADDVENYLDNRPVRAAGKISGAYVAFRFVQRHRVAVLVSVASLFAFALLAVQWKVQRDRALLAQAASVREADAANGVTDFLIGLFSELDPNQHPGRELAARELLAIGRERLPGIAASSPDLARRLELALAGIYANAGDPQQALDLAKPRVPDIDDDAMALQSLLTRAGARNMLFDSVLARDLAARAVAMAEAGSVRGERALARAFMERGIAHQMLNEWDAAEADYQRAEAMYRKFGTASQRAAVVHNRAWLAEGQGRIDDALLLYEQALRDKRQSLSSDHPSTLLSLHGYGKMLMEHGRHAEAKAVFVELAERTARVHGEYTEPMGRAAGELAVVHQELGAHDAARGYYERQIGIERQLAGGRDTLALARAINNYGTLLEEIGDASAAERMYRESIGMRDRLLPEGNTNRTVPRHNLARVLLTDGRAEEASSWIEQAVSIRRDRLDAAHPWLVRSMALQARIAFALGHAEQARALADTVDRTVGDGRSFSWIVRVESAQMRAALEIDPEARVATLRDARDELRAVQPPDHPVLAKAGLALAEAMEQAGRGADARSIVVDVAPILRAALVADAPGLRRLAKLEASLRRR